MTNNRTNITVEDLTTLFAELAYQHRNLSSDQAALRAEINGLRDIVISAVQQQEQQNRSARRYPSSRTIQTTIPSHFAVDQNNEESNESHTTTRRRITIGDRVTIRNPNRGQGNTGVVTGFTRTGFARVRILGSNQVVRRFPFNLSLLPQDPPAVLEIADSSSSASSGSHHEYGTEQ